MFGVLFTIVVNIQEINVCHRQHNFFSRHHIHRVIFVLCVCDYFRCSTLFEVLPMVNGNLHHMIHLEY